MPNIKNFTRALPGEAIISELDKELSREQIVLQPDANGYAPNTMLAKITSGTYANMWGKYDPAATDGRQARPSGMIYSKRPASTGTQRAVALVRTCDLNGKKVMWDTATPLTAAQIATAVAQAIALDTTNNYGGIRVRY